MKSRTIALLALLSLLLAFPVVVGANNHDQFEGTAVIRDDKAANDAITYKMSGVPAPSAGTELVGWLVSDDGSTQLSTGPMEWKEDGSVSHTFDSMSPRYTGEDLIAGYSLLVITEEAVGSDPDAPAGPAAYHHQIPKAAMAHIRHFVSAWPEDSDFGILTHLQAQLTVARSEAMLGIQAATLAQVKERAQRVLNVLVGEGDENFNADVGNPGDGSGIFGHGGDAVEHLGFVEEAAQIDLTIQSAPDDPVIAKHGRLLRITSANSSDFAMLARDRLLQLVLPENDRANAARHMANVEGLLGNALEGLDANGDGTKEPIEGEAGLDEAYLQAQMMATYTLESGPPPTPTPTPTPVPPTPTPEPPVTGDTGVSVLPQIALLLAGLMLIGGAFVFVTSRKKEGQQS